MRITIVTGPLLPVPPIAGGSVHRMWWGLARCFATAGHEVTLLARRWPGMDACEIRDGVKILRRGGFHDSRWNAWNIVRDLIYALTTRGKLPAADVTIINDLMLPIVLKRGGALGAIVTNANRFPKGQYRYYRGVNLIACASRSIAAAVAEQAPSVADRTAVIPNALDVERFRPRGGTARSSVILYVGRIHPEKGLDTLIDAFKIVSETAPDARLVLIGPSRAREGGGGRAYLKLLERRSGGRAVEFRGPEFEPERLAKSYAAAKVFCYPTRAETGEALPVAPLEAMATGCPVVLSNLRCFDDYAVNENNALLFDHRASAAPELLAEQIRRLLADSSLADRLRAAGVQTASEYSYESVAQRYLDRFRDLTGAAG